MVLDGSQRDPRSKARGRRNASSLSGAGNHFDMVGIGIKPTLFGSLDIAISSVAGIAAGFADGIRICAVDLPDGGGAAVIAPENGNAIYLANDYILRYCNEQSLANGHLQSSLHTVYTTDATTTTIASILIPNSATVLLDVQVVANQDSNNNSACYHRRGLYAYQGGTTVLVGSLQTIGTDVEDNAAWDCTLDISGSSVRVRVTGSATDINWIAEVRKLQVG